MTEVIDNQSGTELRIQDGDDHESAAMLENSLDGALRSVSRISMATQITRGSRKNRYLQCPVILN